MSKTTAITLPQVDSSEIERRLPPNAQQMLLELQSQAAKLGATVTRAEQQSARLDRKIKESPEYQKKQDVDRKVRAGRAKLHDLSVQIATLLEQAMYDVPGDDLFSKLDAIASSAGGGQ